MQALANDSSALRIHFHDPDAPAATVVAPSVFVAVRNDRGKLLLVRRCDSGTWELPGGRVDVGESAVEAAVRETREESGIRVRITGLVGLFTDPACVVESVGGTEFGSSSWCASTAGHCGAGRVRTCRRPLTLPGSIPRTSRRCRCSRQRAC